MSNGLKKKILLSSVLLGICLFSSKLIAQVDDENAPDFSNSTLQNKSNATNNGDAYSLPDYQPQQNTNNLVYVKDSNGNLIPEGHMVYDPKKVANCANSQPGEVCSNKTNDTEGGEIEEYYNDNSVPARKIAATDDSPSQCDNDYSTAKSLCTNVVSINAQLGPQISNLNQAFQNQQSASNTKEACQAAAQLNSLTAGVNTGYITMCSNAINGCMMSCQPETNQYTQCQNLALTIKLANLQTAQAAQAYVQSQKCAALASANNNTPNANSNANALAVAKTQNPNSQGDNSEPKSKDSRFSMDDYPAVGSQAAANTKSAGASNEAQKSPTGFAFNAGSSSNPQTEKQMQPAESQKSLAATAKGTYIGGYSGIGVSGVHGRNFTEHVLTADDIRLLPPGADLNAFLPKDIKKQMDALHEIKRLQENKRSFIGEVLKSAQQSVDRVIASIAPEAQSTSSALNNFWIYTQLFLICVIIAVAFYYTFLRD